MVREEAFLTSICQRQNISKKKENQIIIKKTEMFRT
jgi:hypothetical protein